MSELITDEMVILGKHEARRVWGWQFLERYSAQSAAWLNSVLGAVISTALEVVAPLIAVRALRAAREAMADTDDPDAIYMDNGDAELWLRAYTDRVERGES